MGLFPKEGLVIKPRFNAAIYIEAYQLELFVI